MFDRIMEKLEELNNISEFGGYCVAVGGLLGAVGVGYAIIGGTVIGIKKLMK